MKRMAVFIAALGSILSCAQAQGSVTVAELLKQGYEVKGTIFPTKAGPGLMLQSGEKLYLCFIVETPEAEVIKTQYCKLVN